VRQGDTADSMFLIRSGQVCVLIDPQYTAAAAAVQHPEELKGLLPEQDLKRLVQVGFWHIPVGLAVAPRGVMTARSLWPAPSAGKSKTGTHRNVLRQPHTTRL